MDGSCEQDHASSLRLRRRLADIHEVITSSSQAASGSTVDQLQLDNIQQLIGRSMIKTVGITFAALGLVALAGCSSDSDTAASSSPSATETIDPSSSPSSSPTVPQENCDLDELNKEVFPADEGASSIECVETDGDIWAGGTTGPTAAGVTGTYLAQAPNFSAWTLYTGPCDKVPSQLQKYCTNTSASPSTTPSK
jgi:hypothetical protein